MSCRSLVSPAASGGACGKTRRRPASPGGTARRPASALSVARPPRLASSRARRPPPAPTDDRRRAALVPRAPLRSLIRRRASSLWCMPMRARPMVRTEGAACRAGGVGRAWRGLRQGRRGKGEILQLGRIFRSSAIPASVTWVSERLSLSSFLSKARSSRPASVTLVSERFSICKPLSRLRSFRIRVRHSRTTAEEQHLEVFERCQFFQAHALLLWCRLDPGLASPREWPDPFKPASVTFVLQR